MVAVSEQTLDAARQVGDPEVDRLIQSLGSNVWAMNALLAQVTTNDSVLPAALPAELRALVLPHLPAWVDPHRIHRAQLFAAKNLFRITVSLFCASLPLSYTAKSGARILRLAGRMTGDIDRRIHETARFVLDVLEPGGFDAGGSARIAVGKVRFIHAGIRAAILSRSVEAETPINQEDLAGTLGVFSIVVLKGLTRLGAQVDARDREDFIYLWRAIGEMLGVQEHLRPQSFAHGEALFNQIRARQMTPSEDGRELMKVLLEGMEQHMALPPLRRVPRLLVRYLVGDDVAQVLGLPVVDEVGGVPRGVLSATNRLVPIMGKRLLELVTASKLNGKKVTFATPTQIPA